jgi:hypothetical protein
LCPARRYSPSCFQYGASLSPWDGLAFYIQIDQGAASPETNLLPRWRGKPGGGEAPVVSKGLFLEPSNYFHLAGHFLYWCLQGYQVPPKLSFSGLLQHKLT